MSPHSQVRSNFQLVTTCKWKISTESHWGYKPHLRAGPIFRSRWPTKNELSGIWGGSVSHNALLGLFFFQITYRSFVYKLWFHVYEIPVHSNLCVSSFMCFLWAFFLEGGLISSVCFVLLWFVGFMLFYYYSFNAFLFLNE